MLDQINYDFIITDNSKKMQSAYVHVLDIDADSDKIWFYYIEVQKYTRHTYYIVPNTYKQEITTTYKCLKEKNKII